MSSLYRDPKTGTWYVQIGSGKARRKLAVGKHERLARLRQGEIDADIERGGAGFARRAKPVTLADALAATRDARAAHVKPSTILRYRMAGNHLTRWHNAAGLATIDRITTHTVAAYQSARTREGAHAYTVNSEVNVLGAAIRHAGLPVPDYRRLPVRGNVREPRFLTADEVRLLLASCDDGLSPYIMGYLYTGARLMELQAVEWRDIDDGRQRIRLRNIKTSRGGSRDAYRHLPMHPALSAVLGARRALERPWPPLTTILRRLKAASLRAGIGLVRVHDLRHTFASRLAQSGQVSLYQIGALLGHSSYATTQRYAHLVPGDMADVVARLDWAEK